MRFPPVQLSVFHRFLHKCPHAGELRHIVLDILVRLPHRDVDVLRQRECPHAVENPEVYRLGIAAHGGSHQLRRHPEHLRCCGCVDVCAAEERLPHLPVTAEVGKQTQFDLAVVRIQQHTALPSHKELAHISAQLRPHRNVLQIRLCGGDASGTSLCLLEYSVDSAVLPNGFQQSVHISGFQLGVLPPFQHIVHNCSARYTPNACTPCWSILMPVCSMAARTTVSWFS